jgi:hypothetical protein
MIGANFEMGLKSGSKAPLPSETPNIKSQKKKSRVVSKSKDRLRRSGYNEPSMGNKIYQSANFGYKSPKNTTSTNRSFFLTKKKSKRVAADANTTIVIKNRRV